MRVLASVAALLLSGCFYGHCGFMPEAVHWQDGSFYDLLAGADTAWAVTDVAGTGWPIDVPALAGYGDVRGTEAHLGTPGRDGSASLRADGSAQIVASDDASARRDAVALARNLSDMGQDEIETWAQAIVATGHEIGLMIDSRGGVERPVIRYALELPGSNITRLIQEGVWHVSGPALSDGGDWTIRLDPPRREAVHGFERFVATSLPLPEQTPRFEGAWGSREVPQERAMADFGRAYASLGIGPVPTDAYAFGSIC